MRKEKGERRNALRSVVLLESCGVFLCLIRAESLSACLVWTHAVRPFLNRDSLPSNVHASFRNQDSSPSNVHASFPLVPQFLWFSLKRKEKGEMADALMYRTVFLLSPFSFLIFRKGCSYYIMPRSRSSSCHFQAVLSESSSV